MPTICPQGFYTGLTGNYNKRLKPNRNTGVCVTMDKTYLCYEGVVVYSRVISLHHLVLEQREEIE